MKAVTAHEQARVGSERADPSRHERDDASRYRERGACSPLSSKVSGSKNPVHCDMNDRVSWFKIMTTGLAVTW